MIIVSIITLIISTLIQGITSNYLGYTYNTLSIFSTLYVLITILILNPYFENKKKYFAILIIFGLIIDATYTNTFILNTCLYIVCYYISKAFHFFFPYNWVTISISNILCVFTYHTISFLLLNILKYDAYTIQNLLKILSHSIIMTVVYSIIIYFIVSIINKKLGIKEVK